MNGTGSKTLHIGMMEMGLTVLVLQMQTDWWSCQLHYLLHMHSVFLVCAAYATRPPQ
jgi:hypothetical protein